MVVNLPLQPLQIFLEMLSDDARPQCTFPSSSDRTKHGCIIPINKGLATDKNQLLHTVIGSSEIHWIEWSRLSYLLRKISFKVSKISS